METCLGQLEVNRGHALSLPQEHTRSAGLSLTEETERTTVKQTVISLDWI